PLRERPEDIKVLSRHFAEKYAEINSMPARAISDEALQMLLRHGWKGNVRELENTVHRAVLLATGEDIRAEAILLPDGMPHQSAGHDGASAADQAAAAKLVG